MEEITQEQIDEIREQAKGLAAEPIAEEIINSCLDQIELLKSLLATQRAHTEQAEAELKLAAAMIYEILAKTYQQRTMGPS